MTFEGYQLSGAARAKLERIMLVASNAYAKIPSNERGTLEELGIAVWDAFKKSHEVINGKWEPKKVLILHNKRILVGER